MELLCDRCGRNLNEIYCCFCRRVYKYDDNGGICPFCKKPAPYNLCFNCRKIVWIYPYVCIHCLTLYETDGVCEICGRRLVNMKEKVEKKLNIDNKKYKKQ